MPIEDATPDVFQQLIGCATRYTANVSGTDVFWLKQQGRMEGAVDQLQSLTVFTTYSATDHHWYDLHRLMPFKRRGTPAKRRIPA